MTWIGYGIELAYYGMLPLAVLAWLLDPREWQWLLKQPNGRREYDNE